MKVATPVTGDARGDPCLESPNAEMERLSFLVRLWKPSDMAFLHVLQQVDFEPQIWDKCKDSQLICQLAQRTPRRTVLIKIFGQN